ncbi:hypothetical protein J2W17_000299 [Pseudomonas lini]|nr:hypothetical protein [Pseudomonas lini]MDQ0121362.1 hypothetical protein [Pseudomonas lini]
MITATLAMRFAPVLCRSVEVDSDGLQAHNFEQDAALSIIKNTSDLS